MDNTIKKSTIYDVARLSGTSPRSVTRAFQQDSEISEKTRQKILTVAEQIGYRPNKAAGRMRGKSVRIACIIECEVHVFVDEVIRGTEMAVEELRDFKTEVLIRQCITAEAFHEALEEMLALPVDGVVVMSTEIPEKYAEALQNRHIPLILIVLDPTHHNAKCHVQADTLMKWKMAGSMLSLVCADAENIAVFIGRLGEPYLNEYLTGLKDTLEQKNSRMIDVYDTKDSAQEAQRFAEEIVQSGRHYDGIFFASANSVPAIEVFREHRYSPVIVASDVFPKMSDYIREGTVAATVYQNPEKQARLAVMQM